MRVWAQNSRASRLWRIGRTILMLQRARQIRQSDHDNSTLTEELDAIARTFAKFLRLVSSSLSYGMSTSDFQPSTPNPILLPICCGLAGASPEASASLLCEGGSKTVSCGSGGFGGPALRCSEHVRSVKATAIAAHSPRSQTR